MALTANRLETPDAGASAELNKHLCIAMDGEAYGIPVLRVKEIIQYDTVTPIPMMPPFIRGAINLRGRGVPVVDLAARFGHAATEVARRTCIVIVEARPEDGERFDVGLLVDAVNEVRDIDAGSIEPPPSFGGKIRTDFMEGMAKVESGFIILLSVDRIVSLDDLSRAADAAQSV